MIFIISLFKKKLLFTKYYKYFIYNLVIIKYYINKLLLLYLIYYSFIIINYN